MSTLVPSNNILTKVDTAMFPLLGGTPVASMGGEFARLVLRAHGACNFRRAYSILRRFRTEGVGGCPTVEASPPFLDYVSVDIV